MPVAAETNIFVLDNGGGSLKAGYCTQESPRVMPNCIMKAKSEKRRAFTADQIDDCRDLSSLFYMLPMQKGYLVNWDHQKTVWDYLFGPQCFNRNPADLQLIFTEPYFNFTSIQDGLCEMFFEEYQFKTLMRTHPGDLVCYKNKSENPEEKCCLVLDTGFSFTHVVPYVLGKRVREAVRRVDVGGKLLTNHLKEIISYRQLHVLDETFVMNAAKEDSCFVSQDFLKDMEIAAKRGTANTIARDYVLPDFTTIRRGFLKTKEQSTGRPGDGEQIIRLNNERFSVPEILFSPSDIGIYQMGVAEAIAHSISLCEEAARPWLYKNVVVTGGCSLFPGFISRLEKELREFAPDVYDVKVRLADNPVAEAWQGGALLARDNQLDALCITRNEFMEKGPQACLNKFYL